LFVSHRSDELPSRITHYLTLTREGNRPSRVVISEAPPRPSLGAAGRPLT
jgi:hypothetical protein